METKVVILLAEDDDGHAELTMQNLRRGGITNEIHRFRDGQETLNFLFQKGSGLKRAEGMSYILLLDLRMPFVDGIEVIKQVKQNYDIKEMPIIVISTTDDPGDIERCYAMGCKKYIVKPLSYDVFTEAMQELSRFLLEDIIPRLSSGNEQ